MLRKIVPDVVQDQTLAHLTASASVRDAAKLMRQRKVSSIAVVDQGRLLGLVTSRDLICRAVAVGSDPDKTPLGDVMTKNPDTVAPDTTALDALRLMDDGGFRHLPVVDAGRVVAVVSRRDFLGTEKAQLDDETALWERIG